MKKKKYEIPWRRGNLGREETLRCKKKNGSHAWLLYLYTGLALRENILRVNGSDIRPWWIKHHYCAMAMALISLTWEIERGPDCSQKQTGVQLFLYWAIMQGFAMILQNRYQRQRLYTRIAMGKVPMKSLGLSNKNLCALSLIFFYSLEKSLPFLLVLLFWHNSETTSYICMHQS
ncbi:transmembrane protein 120 homolog [Olea europaea var. sylvestris]|uniref:transmembrane protein 120 homolog n=1 Tax=Olea europaea var. sylvestris TaxID=158386 RepID=UPI000C1D7677|nr:transmembrane protein 120 homolog [Olea europaea var. sylvestris]